MVPGERVGFRSPGYVSSGVGVGISPKQIFRSSVRQACHRFGGL